MIIINLIGCPWSLDASRLWFEAQSRSCTRSTGTVLACRDQAGSWFVSRSSCTDGFSNADGANIGNILAMLFVKRYCAHVMFLAMFLVDASKVQKVGAL